MEKILFVATVDQHIRHFHLHFLKWFKENNYEVHVASNGQETLPYIDEKFNIPFERSPFKSNNLTAFRQLKEIIDQNNYRLIHCHTPMGGVITRLASKKARKKGTNVIYTAHGFHYYKGSPLKNWLLYYPIERWLSKYTSVLITLNKEDYNNAVLKKFKAEKVELVDGIGVDLKKFNLQTFSLKNELRQEYGYDEKDFILIYTGELSYRKHQDMAIDAVSLIKDQIPNVKLLLAGEGDLLTQYKKQVDTLGINKNVEFLGYRKDISNLMMLSDVAISTSRQEGLPVNVMEAMAIGLPIVVTDCRGNRDLIKNQINGFVTKIDDVDSFAHSIMQLYNSKDLRKKFSENNNKMIQKYSVENIMNRMKGIYNNQLGK